MRESPVRRSNKACRPTEIMPGIAGFIFAPEFLDFNGCRRRLDRPAPIREHASRGRHYRLKQRLGFDEFVENARVRCSG